MVCILGCAIFVKEEIHSSINLPNSDASCIVIGNSASDIKMAKSAQMTSMFVPVEGSPSDGIIQQYRPDHVVENIKQIPQAVTLLTENSMY